MELEEAFNKWIEWKLYKVLYIGILVPLLFKEAKKLVFQNLLISIIFFITAIILILPLLFKIYNWIEKAIKFVDKIK